MFTFVDYEASTYGDYLYPVWADVLGWLLACLVIAPIFIAMGYRIYKEDELQKPLDVSNPVITKTRLFKYTEKFYHQKMAIFQMKNSDIFYISA